MKFNGQQGELRVTETRTAVPYDGVQTGRGAPKGTF